MVVKPDAEGPVIMGVFESRVILDGSQTLEVVNQAGDAFESRVILDGSQTKVGGVFARGVFESRVILDGSQTARCRHDSC